MVNRIFKAIVVGVSLGGLKALTEILNKLPHDLSVPIIIVQHLPESKNSTLADYLNGICKLPVEEARDKCPIKNSYVYVAPPGYHLLIEEDASFALDEGDYVYFSRPSIDVLFENAAYVYRSELIAIILTGANHDGSAGVKAVADNGGYVIVQDLASAESTVMIEGAMGAVDVDAVVELDQISSFIVDLVQAK